MNHANLTASLARTGQYEAAGTVWMLDAASGAANELQPQFLARPMDWHAPVPSETESVGSLSPRTTEPDSDMSSDYEFYLAK